MSHQKMYSYILLVDDHDEVATWLSSRNNLSPQTNEQTKVIQEVAWPEVSNLIHAVMNKKQGDQMQ